MLIDEERTGASSTFDLSSAFPSNDESAASGFVLECIRRLEDCYPDPIDKTALRSKLDGASIGCNLIEVLCQSGFLSGKPTQLLLTLAGKRSLMEASTKDPQIAKFLQGEAASSPTELLLSIMKTHFYQRENGHHRL